MKLRAVERHLPPPCGSLYETVYPAMAVRTRMHVCSIRFLYRHYCSPAWSVQSLSILPCTCVQIRYTNTAEHKLPIFYPSKQ